jgi:uncharacterized protein YjbJ (UPF0337 family)
MNRERIEGHSKSAKGKPQQAWGRHPDEGFDTAPGQRGRRLGKHRMQQKRHGLAREEADRQFQAWASGSDDSWFRR